MADTPRPGETVNTPGPVNLVAREMHGTTVNGDLHLTQRTWLDAAATLGPWTLLSVAFWLGAGAMLGTIGLHTALSVVARSLAWIASHV